MQAQVEATVPLIVVPVDGVEWRHLPKQLQHLLAAHIPRVDNRLHARECRRKPRIQVAVRVRDHADEHAYNLSPATYNLSSMARARRAPTSERSLTIRDFLSRVHEGISAAFGPELDGLDVRQRFGYLQYYRGSPAVHYEVWAQRKTSRLEIGLHFEGERDRNYEAAELLAMRARDVQAAIGPEYELEEWTESWTRLHRSFPAPVLSEELAAEAAARVVALIRGMEPIIDQMELRR